MTGLVCLKEVMLIKPMNHVRIFICNYYYFLETSFRFQTKARNDCHDLMQKAMSFDDAMRFDVNCFFVKRTDYRIHF